MASLKIVWHGKPFTDREYIKESFIKILQDLFSDFKYKHDIIQKIRDMPLSVRTVKERVIKMATNITTQQIEDINSPESSGVND